MMTLEHKIDICLRWIAAQKGMTDGTSAIDIAWEAEAALSGSQPYNRSAAIEELLTEMGVSGANLGWGYLKTGIELCMEDEKRLHRITHYLYPTIADRHGTTAVRVERAIRHAIDVAFLEGDPDVLYRFFGNTNSKRGRPTNSGFIAGCVHALRRREGR